MFRDVLQHYFKGICPQCNSKGYSYQMSSDFFNRYPELFCSCANAEELQVCPFCMGYRFVFQDKLDARDMAYLEGMVGKHNCAMHNNPLSRFFSCEVYDVLYEELTSSYKERDPRIFTRGKGRWVFMLKKHEQEFLARISRGEGSRN